MINRRHFLTLAGGMVAGSPPRSAAAAEPSGIVTELTGKASAHGADVERLLTLGAVVQIGDWLQTAPKSRLSLTFGRSTIITLGPSTQLRIERHLAEAGGEFELAEGSMFYEHARKPTDAPQKTVVRSPYGLLAVRGTKFFAGPSAGEFGVFVAQGRVDYTSAGATVVLHPGFGSGVRRPGDRPSRPVSWRPRRISQALLETIGRATP